MPHLPSPTPPSPLCHPLPPPPFIQSVPPSLLPPPSSLLPPPLPPSPLPPSSLPPPPLTGHSYQREREDSSQTQTGYSTTRSSYCPAVLPQDQSRTHYNKSGRLSRKEYRYSESSWVQMRGKGREGEKRGGNEDIYACNLHVHGLLISLTIPCRLCLVLGIETAG